MSVQATITCVIFVITILLLVFKPIPIIITGAIIPTALALFGIIKADTAFADFTNYDIDRLKNLIETLS